MERGCVYEAERKVEFKGRGVRCGEEYMQEKRELYE
jgi:hypothetical protein